MTNPPLVTIAIPLYRSVKFIDDIIGNLRAIRYENLEVIISDRHCEDEAIDILIHTFGDDPRFLFIQAHDRLDWVEHYNFLLQKASGTYFMWMPHDDLYPGDYVCRLVAALELDAQAIGVFGQRHLQYLSGRSPIGESLCDVPPRFFSEEPWSPRLVLKLLVSWNIAVPFRGLFRLKELRKHELLLPRTLDTVAADIYWMVRVALHGRLVYVPDTHCTKRRHDMSVSATWRYRVKPRHLLNGLSILRGYIGATVQSVEERRQLTRVLFVWTGFKFVYFTMTRIPLPASRDFAQLAVSAGQRILRLFA